MSHILTIEEAAARLAELISDLKPGDQITLLSKEKPVAKIVPESSPVKRRGFGACKGMLTIIKEDDSHLEDFKDYM